MNPDPIRKMFAESIALSLFFLLTIVSPWAAEPRKGVSLHATGQVWSIRFSPENTPVTNFTTFFNVSVQDCNCLIYTKSQGSRGIDYNQFSVKGPDSYDFVKFLPNKDVPSQNDSTLSIRPSVTPRFSSAGMMLPVWFAFGSQCYFATNTGMTPCLNDLGDRRLVPRLHTVQLKSHWSLSKDAPFLESFVDFREGTFSDEKGNIYPLPDNVATSVTNTSFQVIGWTNVGGLKVPKEFVLIRYEMSPETGRLRRRLAMHGITEEINLESQQIDFIPRLAEKTRVIEQRFPEVMAELNLGFGAEYMSTNGAILSRSELAAYLAVKNKLMLEKIRKPRAIPQTSAAIPKQKNYLQTGLMIGGFALLGTCAVYAWRRRAGRV